MRRRAPYDLDVANVERARAARLRGGAPGPALEHYRKCAADQLRPAAERAQWQQLADELAARIGAPAVETEPLFRLEVACGFDMGEGDRCELAAGHRGQHS